MKIKEAKLQTHRVQFESLKMNEDENIEAYMLRVNEVIQGDITQYNIYLSRP